jgi:hypothetical protein
MQRTHAGHHYAVDKTKRYEDKINNERLAQSIRNNSDRDPWSETKHIRPSKSGISRTIDDRADGINIANLFANKYRDLYTSVQYDINDGLNIQIDIKEVLVKATSYADCIFNLHDSNYAVLRLKARKNDGSTGLTSVHTIPVNDDCLMYIALLFTAHTTHSSVPDSLLYSTILPIPKGRNANAMESLNFRGNALSFINGKLFNNLVLFTMPIAYRGHSCSWASKITVSTSLFS